MNHVVIERGSYQFSVADPARVPTVMNYPLNPGGINYKQLPRHQGWSALLAPLTNRFTHTVIKRKRSDSRLRDSPPRCRMHLAGIVCPGAWSGLLHRSQKSPQERLRCVARPGISTGDPGISAGELRDCSSGSSSRARMARVANRSQLSTVRYV